MSRLIRPARSEYEPYYGRYIDLVPEGDVVDRLAAQCEEVIALVRHATEERGNYRYAPGKWSLKEVLGHVMDTERVFTFRALVFSRRDSQEFPGMEQDDYARAANYGNRTLQEILGEYNTLRDSTVHFFRSLSDDMLTRTGTASGFRFSVRSVLFIIAGHELHHTRIIREKYLS